MHRSIALIATVVTALVFLTACSEPVSDEPVLDEPATLEPIKGTDLSRITLTEEAAHRLGLQTVRIQEAGRLTVVPSAALLVDPDGKFWVYTSLGTLTFVRHSVRLDHDDGSKAFMSAGPPAGSRVVTVGVAELYGAETGIGH